MSRKTKIKLNNIHRYLSRNVFSTKYIVRNTLCIMIFCAIAAITAVMVYVVKEKNKKDEKTAIMLVGENEINTVSVSLIDDNTILVLKEELNAYAADKQPVEVQAVAQASEFEGKFVVTAESLNIRENADETSNIMGRLASGAVGDVLGVSGEWTNISSGGITGYVKTEYILTGSEAQTAMETAEKTIATVTASSVRVRSEASTDADIIMTVSAGETFVVDNSFSDGTWTRVRLADYTYGYVASEYLSMETGYEEAVSIDKINSVKEAKNTAEEKTEEADNDTSDKKTESVSASSDKNGSSQSGSSSSSNSSQSSSSSTDKAESSNEVSVGTTSRGSFGLSDDDIYLLACIVYAESGGESYEGQLAVANVVLNRLQKGSWGNSVSDVIYASGQFTAVNSSSFANALENGPGSTSLSAAQAAASGTNNIGSYTSFRPLRNANTSSYDSYTIIGNHCFF